MGRANVLGQTSNARRHYIALSGKLAISPDPRGGYIRKVPCYLLEEWRPRGNQPEQTKVPLLTKGGPLPHPDVYARNRSRSSMRLMANATCICAHNFVMVAWFSL